MSVALLSFACLLVVQFPCIIADAHNVLALQFWAPWHRDWRGRAFWSNDFRHDSGGRYSMVRADLGAVLLINNEFHGFNEMSVDPSGSRSVGDKAGDNNYHGAYRDLFRVFVFSGHDFSRRLYFTISVTNPIGVWDRLKTDTEQGDFVIISLVYYGHGALSAMKGEVNVHDLTTQLHREWKWANWHWDTRHPGSSGHNRGVRCVFSGEVNHEMKPNPWCERKCNEVGTAGGEYTTEFYQIIRVPGHSWTEIAVTAGLAAAAHQVNAMPVDQSNRIQDFIKLSGSEPIIRRQSPFANGGWKCQDCDHNTCSNPYNRDIRFSRGYWCQLYGDRYYKDLSNLTKFTADNVLHTDRLRYGRVFATLTEALWEVSANSPTHQWNGDRWNMKRMESKGRSVTSNIWHNRDAAIFSIYTPFTAALTTGNSYFGKEQQTPNPMNTYHGLSVDLGEHAFNTLFRNSREQPIIRRQCLNCDDAFKDIFYKRIANKWSFNAYATMKQWTYSNNEFNTHFKLYSNLFDAVLAENEWTYCNESNRIMSQQGQPVGAFADCAPNQATSMASPNQWTKWSVAPDGEGKAVLFSIFTPYISTSWMYLLGAPSQGWRGKPAPANFDQRWRKSAEKPIVRVTCPFCETAYVSQRFYKRHRYKDTFDLFNNFVNCWSDVNNEMSTRDDSGRIQDRNDFSLYSSIYDATMERDEWTYCNFDQCPRDDGIGFPYDCAPLGWLYNPSNQRGNHINWGNRYMHIDVYQPTLPDCRQPGDECDYSFQCCETATICSRSFSYLEAEDKKTCNYAQLSLKPAVPDAECPNPFFRVGEPGELTLTAQHRYGYTGRGYHKFEVFMKCKDAFPALVYNDAVYDIADRLFDPFLGNEATMLGAKYSHYSSWGLALEIMPQSVEIRRKHTTTSSAASPCDIFNGIWQHQDTATPRTYCLRAEQQPFNQQYYRCQLTDARTGKSFYSLEWLQSAQTSTSATLLYIWHSAQASNQILGTLEEVNAEVFIRWKRPSGDLLFSWQRTSNAYSTQLQLTLGQHAWYRIGVKTTYPDSLETCGKEQEIGHSYFVLRKAIKNLAFDNRWMLFVLDGHSGRRLDNTATTFSNIPADGLIDIEYNTARSIYIALQYNLEPPPSSLTNPCSLTGFPKARCSPTAAITSPLKFTLDPGQPSCPAAMSSSMDSDSGRCQSNQYQSNYPMAFHDSKLIYATQLSLPANSADLCPGASMTALLPIRTHTVSSSTLLERTQCDFQGSAMKLNSPHCAFKLTADSVWNVKLVMNAMGCVAMQSRADIESLASGGVTSLPLYLDARCGIGDRHGTDYVSPYFTLLFTGQSTTLQVRWRWWSRKQDFYVGYKLDTASMANTAGGAEPVHGHVALFADVAVGTAEDYSFRWYLDTNFQLIGTSGRTSYCLWYQTTGLMIKVVMTKCNYLQHRLMKEIAFIGGHTLAMDSQYAEYDVDSVPSTTAGSTSAHTQFTDIKQWGVLSSVGDANIDGAGRPVYRKALLRIDPFNDDQNIVQPRSAIANTFDLVSETCSNMGYKGGLVEFATADFRVKYEQAYNLCGHGVHYKCFIGIICELSSGSSKKATWISTRSEVNTVFLEYLADAALFTCDSTQNTISNSASQAYYYYIDGADGKVRRTSSDYNLKDIRMGICEVGESQLVCHRAIKAYAEQHGIEKANALHYYHLHGHQQHGNIWPGHLCEPIQASSGASYGDYINRGDNTILSGLPVIESVSVGWNCRESLFERNVNKYINTNTQITQMNDAQGIKNAASYKVDDVGFIWITHIALDVSAAPPRTMTANECVYLCYQHRSCLYVAFDRTQYCMLYKAKLEMVDYDEYIAFEKCHTDHLAMCVYTQDSYLSNSQASFYKMIDKQMQGGLSESVFEQVTTATPLNETSWQSVRKLYAQLQFESGTVPAFCQQQCRQLSTCHIYAYHERLFGGICILAVSDSNEKPAGDWSDHSIVPTPSDPKPWEIKEKFESIFECFGYKPNFRLCDNQPLQLQTDSAVKVPIFGVPISGVYKLPNNDTVKLLHSYHSNGDPDWTKYTLRKPGAADVTLESRNIWNTLLWDATNGQFWANNELTVWPKIRKQFRVYQVGANQIKLFNGIWHRSANLSSGAPAPAASKWIGDCSILEQQEWFDPSGGQTPLQLTVTQQSPCVFKLLDWTCTWKQKTTCEQDTCCKNKGIAEIAKSADISVFDCENGLNSERSHILIPFEQVAGRLFKCDAQRRLGLLRTYSITDTLHRRNYALRSGDRPAIRAETGSVPPTSPRRRDLRQHQQASNAQPTKLPAETESPTKCPAEVPTNSVTESISSTTNQAASTPMTNSSASEIPHSASGRKVLQAGTTSTVHSKWLEKIIQSSSDCKQVLVDSQPAASDTTVWFIPGIHEDACNELCFFSLNNVFDDRCSNIFGVKRTSYSLYAGCFVILKGDVSLWKHNTDNWLPITQLDWQSAFTVFQLKQTEKRAPNTITFTPEARDIFNNQQIAFQEKCELAYDNGQCTITVERSSMCGPNDNAVIELDYHCKLSDGSVSMTRNIREILQSSQLQIELRLDCRSHFSVQADTRGKLLVTNLLSAIPRIERIFYLRARTGGDTYWIQRLQGTPSECVKGEATSNELVLENDCMSTSVSTAYTNWMYWNDGRLSLRMLDGTYRWLTHNGGTLITTGVRSDAVAWSFDGSFSGCLTENCFDAARKTAVNRVTFETSNNKRFATPMFDASFRQNALYFNGWPALSNSIFAHYDGTERANSYDSLQLVAVDMYFGRNLYKNLIHIHSTDSNYQDAIKQDIEYLSGGSMIFTNGVDFESLSNNGIAAKLTASIASAKLHEQSIVHAASPEKYVFSDASISHKQNKRRFGIYFVQPHGVQFTATQQTFFQTNYVSPPNTMMQDGWRTRTQLTFTYPLYAYDQTNKPSIGPDATQDPNHVFGTIANPYSCHLPYIPGTICIHECQYGFTTICPSTGTPVNYAAVHSPYRIKQIKSFETLEWQQQPAAVSRCCALAETCALHSNEELLAAHYSTFDPSVLATLTSALAVTTGAAVMSVSAHSQLLPWDLSSHSVGVKCRRPTLELASSSLAFDASSKISHRFCRFRDRNPYHGEFSGPHPLCIGPGVTHTASAPTQSPPPPIISKPLIWQHLQSFYLNEFQCQQSAQQPQSSSSDAIPLFAYTPTDSTIYSLSCELSIGQQTFRAGTPLYSGQKIAANSDSNYPSRGDPFNYPLVTTFNLPMGIFVGEHSAYLEGIPRVLDEPADWPRKTKICLSNIVHYPNVRNELFSEDNCVELDMKVLDPPPLLLYYPSNAKEFANFSETQIKPAADRASDVALFQQRHVVHAGGSFEIKPIVEPAVLMAASSSSSSNTSTLCGDGEQEVIDLSTLQFKENLNAAECVHSVNCIGNVNKGITVLSYSQAQHLAIYGHNEYFELLNIRNANNEADAKVEAIAHCQDICSLDVRCKAVVLTINDHRRVPPLHHVNLHGQTLNTLLENNWYICDVFYLRLQDNWNSTRFDRFEQPNSFYFEKQFEEAPPLFVTYEKKKCKAMSNAAHIVRGLSVGYCTKPYTHHDTPQSPNCGQCICGADKGFVPITGLQPLHYNLFAANAHVFDARIIHPDAILCDDIAAFYASPPSPACTYITKTCLCAASDQLHAPPLRDAIIGFAQQCKEKGYVPKGIDINFGLRPYLVDGPQQLLCSDAAGGELSPALSSSNVNGLSEADMEKFLALFTSNDEFEAVLNTFVKVADITSRGYRVLPSMYQDRLKQLGWNCKHSENGQMVPLPAGFHIDSASGKIWSARVPRYVSSRHLEVQRLGHATYHKCFVLYCNTAGCIANSVKFEVLPAIPQLNPRGVDFLDTNPTREVLQGNVRWTFDVAGTADTYRDIHHFDLWIDDGFNLDKAVKLYQSVTQWNDLSAEFDQPTKMYIADKYFRRGYRFLAVVACSTFWCFTSEYNMSAIPAMHLDRNQWYQQHTNLIEFFDYGDRPYYAVRNITSKPFVDRDGNEDIIAGLLTFEPANFFEYTEYRVYAGVCPKCRNYLLYSLKWRISERLLAPPQALLIPKSNIHGSSWLLLVTANEHGENDQNVFIPLHDVIYRCSVWHPCDQACIASDYQHNNNSMQIEPAPHQVPFQVCANHSIIRRRCHQHTCPLSKVSIWPKYDNMNPDINYQRQGVRAYGTTFYHSVAQQKPLYLYTKYSFEESRSFVKVTIFRDEISTGCSDRQSPQTCLEHVKQHECLKKPLTVLPDCRFSCGCCSCAWGEVAVPPQQSGDSTVMQITPNSLPTIGAVRDVFVIGPLGLPDANYLVSVLSVDAVSTKINISIVSRINKYGWSRTLRLVYIVDSTQPVRKQIPYDIDAVNFTLYERHQQEALQYNSIVALQSGQEEEDLLFSLDGHQFGLVKIEIISWLHHSFTAKGVCTVHEFDANQTNNTYHEIDQSWMYDQDGCGVRSNTIYVDVVRPRSLSEIKQSCSRYYVDYDNYDRWLVESFNPEFAADEDFYAVFDENPHNVFGELHLQIVCPGNLTWFIQIGVEEEWIEWLTMGFYALPHSTNYFESKMNEFTGRTFMEEMRLFYFQNAGRDRLVPKDERIPIVTNISIKIVDDQSDPNQVYESIYILTCTRLPDYETITPVLLKPKYGDIVPTGFFLAFLLREDAYPDTLQLLIKPRESAKYPTDDGEPRLVIFDETTWVAVPKHVHALKFCEKLTECLSHTELHSIVKAVHPNRDLLEFSLYDFRLQFRDRWNNPTAFAQVNEVMIVRDWSEDLHVLRVIYDALHGEDWYIRWDIDNDDNFCDNVWYGVKCNALKQIVSLHLFGNNLYGTLPAEIGKLSMLHSLDLSSNYITGTIPSTFQLLFVCQQMSLAGNSLVGSIPNGLENMFDLQTLNLAGNMLSGTLPLGLLVAAKENNLKTIYLNGNRLTGYIPDKLRDVKGLNLLYLADNDWYCVDDMDVLHDYSTWATFTDYTSINKCIHPPRQERQKDIDPPHELI